MPRNAAQHRDTSHTGRTPAVSQGPATTITDVAPAAPISRYQTKPRAPAWPLATHFLTTVEETAMHTIIMHDLVQAHTDELHRQAGRDTLSLAARRARHAPAKTSTPFTPAHTTAELIRRVLTLLGARRPERPRQAI